MPSLMELVERVNKGELIDPTLLETYQSSENAAEKFLSNHARAMLELRRSHGYLLDSLEAIDYADQKVLFQFLAVLGFLGLTDRRAEPVIKFGAAAISRREVALGLEAIQNGVIQDQQTENPFTHDRDNRQFVAQQYDRAAQMLGWFPPSACDWKNPQLRIGYLVSGLADDEACSRMALGLARNLDAKEAKLYVYATEAGVRREKLSFTQGPFIPSTAKRGRETLDTLTRRRASTWVAPLDQDLAACARELAGKIHQDQIDVLIVDATLADPIAAIICGLDCCRAKVNLVRRQPIVAGAVDAAIYLDAQLYSAERPMWDKQSVASFFVHEGVDATPADAAPGNRQALGIPEQSVVITTTFAEGESASGEFADVMVSTLRQNPQTILLVTGDSDGAALRRRLESAGLGKRVGFAGKRKDSAEMLRVADLFVAPFPRLTSSAPSILAAMAAGRAVVAMAGPHEDPQRPQAFIGDEHACTSSSAYAEQITRLIREPAVRQKAGEAMKARATEHFAFTNTAREIEKLCRDLVTSESRPAKAAA